MFSLRKTDKTEMILKGNLTKGMLYLSLPIMISNLIQTVYNLTDTFWVSKISSESIEVGAISLVWPIIMLTLTLGIGMNISGTSLVAQYLGANEKEKTNKLISQLFILALVLGTFIGILIYNLSPYIVGLMAPTEEIFNLSNSYLKIIVIQTPIYFMFMVYSSSRQGQGDTFSPMLYTFIGVILNIILDPILILYYGMGIEGAAIATVISRVVVYIYPIIKLFTDKSDIHISRDLLKIDREYINKISKIAIPASIGQASSSLGFAVLNTIIASYGINTLTAFSIGNRISSVMMMPVMGIGTALSTYVGISIGANNIKRAKDSFKTSLFITTILMVFGAITILLVRDSATRIFIEPSDVEVYRLTTTYLVFVAFNFIFMGIFQNVVGVFQGSGHTIYSFIITMSRLWLIRLPIIFIAQRYTNLGNSLIWYAMLLSNVVVCLAGLYLYKKEVWTEKKI